MKFYLHMAIAIKDKKKPKLSEYTINEYSTFQEALQAFQRTFSIYDDRELLSFRYINEKEIIGRLSTSKKSLSPKVKKNLLTEKYFLSFKRAECKYLCSRDYSEIGLDHGYGSHRKSYIVMETNYKKVAQEYEYNDDKIFEDKIYSVISRLPIKNPRSKAHIICIAVVCFVLIAGLAIGYIYMGSQKQTGETSVLESVCSTARERYALRQDYIMMGDDDADLGINTKEEQQWHYYNQQNTAVCVDTKSYSENGYLYSLYQLNEDEEKKITQKGIELKKADKTKKLTPFLGNAPKGSKYSVGSIYFIGGRNSRKFILYKDRSDAMYIGKCVGIESLKEHSIKDRKT